jgi:type I restriction enzyme S subunit
MSLTPLLEIDLKWAYYALLSCDINTLDSGSAIPSTSRDAFYNLDVYLPPLENQKEIAHILGPLDDKIELNRKMCKTLEEIAQTLFKHWFIDFEFPNEQGKPYKSSGGEMVDSELGPIPKGWSVVGLSDEFSITMGQSPPGSTYNQTGDGLPFFQGNADFGFRFPVNRVFCSDPRRVARPGDTLISVRAPVGEINMAHDLCCIGRGISSVMHKSGSNAFTYYAMHSLKKKLSSFNDEGTVFGCIGKKDFNLMKWLKTSVGIVFAYDSYASNLDRMINSRSRQILMLYRLKLTLIVDLIVFWSSNAS